jgi:hypothetical protein
MYGGAAPWDRAGMRATVPFEAVTTQLRELDRRTNDGMEVALLWRKSDNSTVVSVRDIKTGSAFKLDVRDDEQALDVFHHPYAYAAWRGIDPSPLTTEALTWAA